MMKENKMDGMMKLNEEQLEEVAGGIGSDCRGKYLVIDNYYENMPKPCTSWDWNHKWINTGEHREVDVLPFGIGGWTNGQDLYKCTICGYTWWSHDPLC